MESGAAERREDEDEGRETPGSLVRDPELVAMGKIHKMIAGLSKDSQQAVMSYLNRRFPRE